MTYMYTALPSGAVLQECSGQGTLGTLPHATQKIVFYCVLQAGDFQTPLKRDVPCLSTARYTRVSHSNVSYTYICVG
jgi:hypothetical protein